MRQGILSLILFFLSSSSLAQTMGLAQVVQTAKEASPDIAQMKAQYDSAIQKTWLAVAPAEPTLSIMENDMSSDFHLGTAASKVIQVQQTIGFPGRALLNRAALNDQADSLRYQLRAMELQVSTNVKTAYFALQLAQKNTQLNGDTKLAFERIMEVAKRRYESGAAAQVDFINAQVALLSNENDLEDLQAAEQVARAQLNVLLKRSPSAPISVDPIKMIYYPEPNLQQSADKMMSGRYELRAARSTEKATEKAYKLAWMTLLPDFQFTVGTTEYRFPWASPYSGNPANNPNQITWPTQTYMAGVQITVPLWFMFNERAVISGASSDRAAAERNVDVVYNQSKVALETAIATLHSGQQKILKFEQRVLPLSDQAFRLALIAYSAGKIDFQTLSDTAMSRRQTRLNYATAVVNYLTTYATYGQLIGEDLQ